MGIPIGKLSLYTACAGIPPSQCMPIQLDVGTNNEALRAHPMYLGYPHPRIGGEAYAELVDELIAALYDRYPKLLLQFEDFLTPNAFALLARYREHRLCFNDDIQGTAAVALAGVLASTRATGTPLRDMRILFLGAGSAATGIGELIVRALEAEGLAPGEACQRLSFVDSKGLIVASRDNVKPHQRAFAHDRPQTDFLGAIDALRPHVLIGATGNPGTFTETAIGKLATHHRTPVVFALSNPTSRAECTAEEAYAWSDGRALFASGSPFDPVVVNGVRMRPGQGNNAYVFPGIGMGALAVEASRLPEELFLTAARALAAFVSTADLDAGALYPKLGEIRRVSHAIATAVAERAIELGLAGVADLRGDALSERIRAAQYDPYYGERPDA
jgi:malate dehydrogenase (oxaloacetate-decarboxylating)(NADP+)